MTVRDVRLGGEPRITMVLMLLRFVLAKWGLVHHVLGSKQPDKRE
ncbi:MAG: hypothetical protein ACRDYF_12375 [Acidimicrobiia bacterium]